MYPIPVDFDTGCFVGSTLYEVCSNANQIRLKLDSGLDIVVEGRMVLRASATQGDSVTISPQSPSIQIYSLIETQITSVQLSPHRMNLILFFSGGQSVELIGDEPYECYRIQLEDREVIV